jgi:DNA-binding NarL/FixJ family response regulator
VIIENQPLLRIGIKNAILQSPVMHVCGEANSGEKGLAVAEKTNPDIVLVNIQLPDMNGIDVTIAIKQRLDCKIVILSNHTDSDEIVNFALSNGASSFVLSSSEPETLTSAIALTYENECWIDHKLTSKSFLENRSSKNKQFHKGKKYRNCLTCAEIRVLNLMARGLSNEQIASAQYVCVATIKSQIHELNQKLEAKNRVHAVLRGALLGYINYHNVICEALGET